MGTGEKGVDIWYTLLVCVWGGGVFVCLTSYKQLRSYGDGAKV